MYARARESREQRRDARGCPAREREAGERAVRVAGAARARARGLGERAAEAEATGGGLPRFWLRLACTDAEAEAQIKTAMDSVLAAYETVEYTLLPLVRQ